MPRKGGRRKKTRTHVVETDENVRGALASEAENKIPRSLVIRRGKVESEVIELVADLRNLMKPHTAANFKEDAKNRKITLATYARELGNTMGITHIMALSQNKSRLSLRIARTPLGPTLTFQAKRFTLGRQIKAVQRRPHNSVKAFSTPPVVVTNNFGDATAAPHVKLMRITFQNMFPAINVTTVKLNECRRVVLFNYMRRNVDESKTEGEEGGDEEVEMRHYAIRATPVGVDRKVRRLVEAKIPDLSRLEDISDYITGQTALGAPAPPAPSGALSDSEPEDEQSHVVLPGKFRGKGNNKSQKSALKLIEIGPRLRLKLVKVERGLSSGDVMYHAFVTKTPEEVLELKERKEGEVNLKKRRRDEQDANVSRKQATKDEKKAEKEKRKKNRDEAAMAALRGEAASARGQDRSDEEMSEAESGSEEEDDDSGED